MKKFIFIIIAVLLVFSCAKKDLSIFESEADHSAWLEVDLGEINAWLFGGWIDTPTSVPYWVDSVGSWIYIRWDSDMQGGAADVKIYKVEDMTTPVAYTETWEYGNKISMQILKPSGNLVPNQTYVVVFKGSGIRDAYGNKFDIDNDGVMGEPIDDNFYRSFATRKDDGTPSTIKPLRIDLSEPYVQDVFPMHPTDTTVELTSWCYDARICVYIRDYKPDTLGGSLRSTLDPGTVNTNNIKLFDKLTGAEVSGTISYQSDTAATQWGRLLFTPASNLTPGKTYFLRLYGDALRDPSGNKLNKIHPGFLDYEFTVVNLKSNYTDTLPGDYVPPTVTGWGDFWLPEIIFSEVVDKSTINPATIISYDETPLTMDIVDKYVSGKNVTVVYIRRFDGSSMSGKKVKVRGIKDTAGNIMSGEFVHTY